MKKYVLIFGTALMLMPFLASAQTSDATSSPALPSVTITPDNPFYFLVSWREGMREFFTFNQEAKARLQIEFAARRLAEIKALIEKKGAEAPGLDVAESRLKNHLARAGGIIENLKSRGQNVEELSGELEDDFNESKSILKDAFGDQIKTLEGKTETLEKQLEAALKSGNAAEVQRLRGELNNLKDQKNGLEQKKSNIDDETDVEEEHIREGLGLQVAAERAIQNAEKKKQELIDETKNENIELPSGIFDEFDQLLNQAKNAYSSGNYESARDLAKEAKNSLEKSENRLEKIKDNLEESSQNKEIEKESEPSREHGE